MVPYFLRREHLYTLPNDQPEGTTRRILGKLKGANRPEAVALGGRQGLINLDTRNELRLLEEAITLGWQPEGVHRSVYVVGVVSPVQVDASTGTDGDDLAGRRVVVPSDGPD